MLAEIAPRLARAQAAWIAWDLDRDRRRRHLIGERARLESLVAHRDLQLIRSGGRRGASRDAGYMADRARKLRQAEKALGRIRARLAALEAER
jgi:hypothetical protein